MASWNEIESLQADFKRAQESTTVQKLSERNCIEILIKLQQMKLLEVIHTIDGKEYLTPSQLSQEIRDELYVHGGRVSLVELQSLLNVDYSHIEAKCNEIVSSTKSMYIILGQLLDATYLDHIAEEINDTLQSLGQMTIADLCKAYDLPGDFLVPELVQRLGTIIDGRLDETNKDAIFTESFIARHKARIRGILTAITRPTSLQPILGECKMSTKLFYAIVDDLVAEKRICGNVANRRSEKSTFLPEMYIRTQNQWIENFYNQNNYLEYEALTRLDIADPKSYVRQRFKDLVPLTTVCVGPSIVDLVTATIDDTLLLEGWTDIMPILPTSFSTSDCNQLLQHILQGGKRIKESQAIVIESIIVCPSFIESCTSFFNTSLKEKAERKVKDATVYALTEEEIKLYSASTGEGNKKGEKKVDRRKKATEGSGSTKTGGGAGVGAREVKTKGKDKKRLKKQRELEAEIEERVSTNKQKSQKEDVFMDTEEIVTVLSDNLPACPDQFLYRIAEEIRRPLNTSYQELSKSVFQLAISENKKQESEQSDKVHGSPQKKSRKHHEEEMNTIWCNVKLFSESLGNFEGELKTTLERHLLRTVCADLINVLFNIVGSEYLAGLEESNKMTTEMRLKILARLPEVYQAPLQSLHQTINGKSIEDFINALTEACSHNVCSIMLKKTDKKRDRQLLHGHKMTLIKQLEEENEPATALHLAVVIIFQSVTGQMLHMPGKCVPDIIVYLHDSLSKEACKQLLDFKSLVMQTLTMDAAEEDLGQVTDALRVELPKLRELAATTKKKKGTAENE